MTESAEIIQVIKTVSLIGMGVEDNPFEQVTEYWLPDGTRLGHSGVGDAKDSTNRPSRKESRAATSKT
jgi:hypothetical protein